MYTEQDLDAAVAAGVLSADAAASFRRFVAGTRAAPAVDEEHFRLISGFNDIFVSIAILLLLLSLSSLGETLGGGFGHAAAAAVSWGLAEYFTRRRRMALPSIVLLLSFVGGVFTSAMTIAAAAPAIAGATAGSVAIGAGCAALAAYLHWQRFRVPITIAAGAAALAATILAGLFVADPNFETWLNPALLAAGLLVFLLAMRWDMSDRERLTRRSDVAFWLHLVAAPLIIHPLFTMLGLVGRAGVGVDRAALAVAIYLVLALVALVIDRRAVLVSALAYVLYATSALFRAAGSLTQSFALTALCIGTALLLLSALWQPTRRMVVSQLSTRLRTRLPAA
jgi:hypothetical protein